MDMTNNSRREAGKAWEKQSGKEEDDDSSMDRLNYLPEPLIRHILTLMDTRSASCSDLSTIPKMEMHLETPICSRFSSKNMSNYLSSDLQKVRGKGSVVSLSSIESQQDLFFCSFFAGEEEVIIDPFSNLPCLKQLVLNTIFNNGNDDIRLRISGLQLLSLSLSDSGFHKMEIYTPKLKHFTLLYSHHLVEFTELALPSLDRADIHVEYLRVLSEEFTELALPSLDRADIHVEYLRVLSEDEGTDGEVEDEGMDGEVEDEGTDGEFDVEDWNEYTKQQMVPFFHGLSNATSLVLCSRTIQLLWKISYYLEDQPSPFTRLKSLIVGSPSRSPDDVLSSLLNYFLKGSSDMKPVVKFS
uniref:Uncharacterized protein n=1 Tax=Linum usitatissimum TaxID=4006 RepID=A0A165G0Q7_LINUS|nr:hypothetical protein [Linum usitatissimum]